ncbi:hypothetical protein HPP_0680 [Hydrangea phyllody phytoplasma]|uniref:Uncharacterized protein n=2 Tax=16SrI (Aster yellows group) TaxID=3042590 RepID=A0ABQ5PS13_9MOLU|nr:hypothetical protein [Hydrangea phyllody phytoplasma]GFZ75110.1 hypothetical protein HPP_0680 [Hydrangea phyllody phytoplasma]GLH61228.1 hypothetical protein RHYP_1730 [Rhus yellows phytoplasma]
MKTKSTQENTKTTSFQTKYSTPIKEDVFKSNKLLLFLHFVACLMIILYVLLRLNIIYYENQIPWLTSGINNFINLFKNLGGK